MNIKTLTDSQLFELELEQLKAIELLENEEMWTQRVIDESACDSNTTTEFNAIRNRSENLRNSS